DPECRRLGMWLHGEQIPETDDRGQPVRDASYLAIFNADPEPVEFTLPEAGEGGQWIVEIDTATDDGETRPGAVPPNGSYTLEGRSLAVLRQGEGGGAR